LQHPRLGVGDSTLYFVGKILRSLREGRMTAYATPDDVRRDSRVPQFILGTPKIVQIP
jgi:hypothetical protein